MYWIAKWITSQRKMGDIAPVYAKEFQVQKAVEKATLTITALGVYEATLNGQRIGDYVLAPGWTSYEKRLQYQEYDITRMIAEKNCIQITVGKGWYQGLMTGPYGERMSREPDGVIAQIDIVYKDGSNATIGTNESWQVSESPIRFSEIYNGEICDARINTEHSEPVSVFEGPACLLVPQRGEKIIEQERIQAIRVIHTPKGETVIDFGQELTGYVEVTVEAKEGEVVRLTHGEVLDKDGNFYRENYRKAKAEYTYICREGEQIFHPQLTFFGFRYVRVEEFPGGPSCVKAHNFKAVAVYSDMKRTGTIRCSNAMLNQLFSNIIWGQKSNFLDVPTDCPQRDERLGWTGDAQVFVKAAAYNFDVERFFIKWLEDMRLDQMEDGGIPQIIPDVWKAKEVSSGWADAVTICPWEIYRAYGNDEILKDMFPCMKKYVDYITTHTREDNLWIGGFQFGDWLGLDAKPGSYTGASRKGLIATAYYAYSTELLIKTGHIIGEDVTEYEALYYRIVKAFREKYPVYKTQTECALAVHFRLAEDCQAASDYLVKLIQKSGMKLKTGFIGTPYLLHALSEFGHSDIAYTLLLNEEYPSWLYPITKGATTIWEHWDGIMENGEFWDTNMNSFNHYAYGAVIDWVYSVAGGITPLEAGYKNICVEPHPDDRLEWLAVDLDTRNGKIHSEWKKQDNGWRYEIITPVKARIIIQERLYEVEAGSYYFYSE